MIIKITVERKLVKAQENTSGHFEEHDFPNIKGIFDEHRVGRKILDDLYKDYHHNEEPKRQFGNEKVTRTIPDLLQ